MRVADAIELLKELPPDAYICAQWYDQEDMTKYGETMTEEIWNLAVSIFNTYEEINDMYYTVEQAVEDARIKLEIQEEEDE